jgi:putative peptide zinc metalloprotease protein
MLLPIFKFDGYWLLSDGLGVTNLSAQVRRAAVHLRDGIRGRTTDQMPWPGWVTAAILGYGVFTVVFLAYFFSRLAPALAELAISYPAQIGGLIGDLTAPPYRPATGRLHSVLFPTYTLVGGCLLIVAVGRRLFTVLRRRRARQAVRPSS